MEMDMSTESPNATTETVASTEPASQIEQPSENQKKDAVTQSGYCLHSITDRGLQCRIGSESRSVYGMARNG